MEVVSLEKLEIVALTKKRPIKFWSRYRTARPFFYPPDHQSCSSAVAVGALFKHILFVVVLRYVAAKVNKK